jgi:hypothetical protein
MTQSRVLLRGNGANQLGRRNWKRATVVAAGIQLVILVANTPIPAVAGTCGNGIIDVDEDCDGGGTCIGGSNAGTHCTAESQCTGNGVCIDPSGLPEEIPCVDDSSCTAAGQVAGSKCVHCLVQGTSTCAANCTTPTAVTFQLQPGVKLQDGTIESNTSGATIHGDLTLALPLTGTQTLYLGKLKNGTIPVTVPAASVQFPAIPIVIGGQVLACACTRGVAAKTCGGTVFTASGGLATNCTPGFSNNGDIAHDGPCPADLPCAFIHGTGNSATGVVACTAPNGLNINVNFTQDGTGSGVACTANSGCQSGSCIDDPNGGATKICAAFPPSLTLTGGGTGAAGSGLLLNSTAIGNNVGDCTGFCTEADPYPLRGTVTTLPLTTGKAGGTFTAADGDPGTTICNCSDGGDHCSRPATCNGPLSVDGKLLNCTNLTASPPRVSGSLVGAFTAADQAVFGDAVVTNVFAAVATATPTPTPGTSGPCVLDVDGNGVADVATDVVYIARHLLGLASVPPSFRMLDPTIPTDSAIAAKIDALCPGP